MMGDCVLFQMREPFRQSVIEGHLFYVEQARKRLLSQFDETDMKMSADQAAEEWLEKNRDTFDPDRHDPADFFIESGNIRDSLYQGLCRLRDQTKLSIVAGMFHEWDKNLRDWLVREIQHWHTGENLVSEIWSVNSSKISELLCCLGWKTLEKECYNHLDACRLVVNVYKHGAGKSLTDLKQKYPDYIVDPLEGFMKKIPEFDFTDHTHLKVNEAQMHTFSEAIVAFWRDVPENVFRSQITNVPEWFGRAMRKDNTSREKMAEK